MIGGGDFGEDRLVPDILRAYDDGRPVEVRNPDAIRPWQHVLNPLSGYLALAQALCGCEVDPVEGDHSVGGDSVGGVAGDDSVGGGPRARERARASDAVCVYDPAHAALDHAPSVPGSARADHDPDSAHTDDDHSHTDETRYARAFNFGPRPQDARTVLEIVQRLDGLLDGALGYELDDVDHPPEASRLELDSTAAERRLGWRPCWDLDEALARVAAWHEAHRRGEDMRSTSLEQIAAFH